MHNFELVDVQIREHVASGRNRLFTIDGLTEKTWLIKQSFDSAQTEGWFYAEVADEFGAAPHCLIADRNSGIVVIEHLTSASTLYRIARDDPAAFFDQLPALATLLVRMHGILAKGMPTSSSQRPQLDPVDLQLWECSSPAARELTKYVQQKAALGTALREAAEISGPAGLIHGDLKLNNILQTRSGQLIVIDWELSGVGAVAADIGAVIGSSIALWVDQLALDETTEIADWVTGGAVSFADLYMGVQMFVIAYLAGASARRIPIPARSLIVAHTAAWIIGRTWADASLSLTLAPQHYIRLMAAEGLMNDPEQLFGGLSW